MMVRDANRRTSLGVAFLVVTAFAALSGCGGSVTGEPVPAGSGTGSLSSRLATMNDAVHYKMIAKKSVHSTIVMAVNGRQVVHGTADYRFHRDQVDMKVAMRGLGERLGKVLSKLTGKKAGGKGDIVVLIVDGVLYEKIPFLPADKPWITVNPEATGALARSIGPMVKMIQNNNDPTKILEMAAKAGKITNTKREQVDGQRTTHYSITVDTEKMLNRVPDSPFKRLAKLGASQIPDSYPIDIWLDSDKLPVRISIQPPIPGQASRVMRADYSGWGEPVEIEAPPKDQVGKLHFPSLTGMPSIPPTGSAKPTN